MAQVALFAFNRGLISRFGAARVDVKRLALGASRMMNWLPRVLGSMGIRPGMIHIGATKNNRTARLLDFVFSQTDKALIEMTDLILRVWISDALITRPSVSAVVANSSFVGSLASWTDDDEAGAASTYAAGDFMQLVGAGTTGARRTQAISIAAADIGVEHALTIQVTTGPVTLRVGTTAGADDVISETSLDAGWHSLAFTPTGATVHIRFQSLLQRITLVKSCAIAAAGAMEIVTPIPEAALGLVRAAQSGDILFVATSGYPQQKIERRAARSWSVVEYFSEDGPFRTVNISTLTMAPSVTTGNGTITASRAYFTAANVGSLIQITSSGQSGTKTMTAVSDVTGSILVTGLTAQRAAAITITGLTGTGNTVVLQRSTDNTTWSNVTGASYTADTTTAYNDALDNQDLYYRLRCSVYASGSTISTISIGAGSQVGTARITAFTSSTLCNCEIRKEMGATSATDNWAEGAWSARRGYPSATTFHEGRLWWAGKDRLTGSVSDSFYSHDPTYVGDAGPMNRTIGNGPVDSFSWLISLQRLILGAQGAEFSCRSTSLDEPLTPTNLNLKPSSTQGSSPVSPVKVDASGVFVQRGGTRVYELAINPSSYDYESQHLSAVIPEIGRPSISRVASQRQPETRVHFVRADGTMAILTWDKNETLVAWAEANTDGLFEDACVMPSGPGENEDAVYYVVKRTINGATVRYIERLATEDQCRPTSAGVLTASYLADCLKVKTGAASTSVTGLSHLEAKQVVVWADGAEVGRDSSDALLYTVAGGAITLAAAASTVVVGLPYTAQWQSNKLHQIPSQMNQVLTRHKRISGLGLVLADTHPQGLTFGRDFANMDSMPSINDGSVVDQTIMQVNYDNGGIIFPGDFSSDERLCLQAIAPRPCTVVCAVIDAESH